MTSQTKKKKGHKTLQTNSLQGSANYSGESFRGQRVLPARVSTDEVVAIRQVVVTEEAMPTADVVAAERAREVAYESALEALRAADEGSRGEASDSGSSDSELRISVLGTLRRQHAAPRVPPAATAVLPSLAAALRDANPLDVRFLDSYRALLEERSEYEVRAVTEELMRSVEDVLMAGDVTEVGAGAVVLAGWLSAALAWRAPRVPAALPALHCLLCRFTSTQVTELARALHASLDSRELLAVSDAVRGREDGGLSVLLLRATLAGLLQQEPAWTAGAPSAAEMREALASRWATLGAEAQVTSLALAGRVLAGGGRGEAGPLLAALAPPSRPRDGHDPDYLKVSVAVKTLRNLFKNM